MIKLRWGVPGTGLTPATQTGLFGDRSERNLIWTCNILNVRYQLERRRWEWSTQRCAPEPRSARVLPRETLPCTARPLLAASAHTAGSARCRSACESAEPVSHSQ